MCYSKNSKLIDLVYYFSFESKNGIIDNRYFTKEEEYVLFCMQDKGSRAPFCYFEISSVQWQLLKIGGLTAGSRKSR